MSFKLLYRTWFKTGSLIVCLGAIATSPVVGQRQTSSIDSAESAIRLIRNGDIASAAEVTKGAIDRDPGSSLLHDIAGAILLMTGDISGATSEFGTAQTIMPDDSLATYGRSVIDLQKGERIHALDLAQIASRNGDKAACDILERYIENLNGLTGSGNPVFVPEAYAPSAKAIGAMNNYRAGRMSQAIVDCEQLLDQLTGDRYSEFTGLLMTFDAKGPFRFAASLPTGLGLSKNRAVPLEKVISGTVTLSPDDVSDAGYVVFKIDGAFTGVINTQPYKYVWNTARVTNGLHKVEIIVYDRAGRVTNRAERDLRTANSDAPALVTPETSRSEQVRLAIWQILMIKPSRQCMAYHGALAARSVGNVTAAAKLIGQSAAILPDFKDTLNLWKAIGPCEAYPPIWRGDPEEKVVALTFDDGPKPGLTEKLIGTLQQLRVPATFFVIGRHVSANPDTCRKIVEAGFEIENHSYTHPNLAAISIKSVERELLKTNDAVQSIAGKKMHFFRPPGGNINNDVVAAAGRWGLTPCMWTVDGESLENGSPDKLVEYVVQKASPGAIILLHNGRMTTIDGLPKIVEGLRRRGFGFVTIEQLMERRLKSSTNAVNMQRSLIPVNGAAVKN